MASKKFFHARAKYIYPTPDLDPPITPDNLLEFDEADLWIGTNPNAAHVSMSSVETTKKMIPSSRSSKKANRKIDTVDRTPVTCASLPVNIPDWSKIYRAECRRKERYGGGVDDHDTDYDDANGGGGDDDDKDGRVPPHEYLARKRGASFSVHEGIGRTLKGRDLRQVRNAIWKRVGFED